jgi:hypothetical protein
MNHFTFQDNKGRRLTLPGHLSITDLLRLGFTGFHLAKPGDPLPDGRWSSLPRHAAAANPNPSPSINRKPRRHRTGTKP